MFEYKLIKITEPTEELEKLKDLKYNALICQDNFTSHFISNKHLHSYDLSMAVLGTI